MKLYLAGPMSGIPKFNVPAFDAAAAALRAQGHEVISPTEEDSPEVRAASLASQNGAISDYSHLGETWGRLVGRCVTTVADTVEGVVLLPGWIHSRGARLEAFVAVQCRKTLLLYAGPDAPPTWLNPFLAMAAIHQFTLESLL